ncbi:MAG: hypothetical protein AAGI52_14850 [Bacteroidota bacterium]
MGKLTLLLVGAAVVGGSLLTFSSRQIAGETLRGHNAAQADLLSRQIAESGHAVILAAIVDDSGFQSPPISTRSYEGGTYRVEYDPTSTATRAQFSVTGTYAGASHTVRSTYDWDPMEYPAPAWLDVPYATASTVASADINNAIQFDRRKHDEMGLNSLVPLADMNAGLQAAATTAGASYSVPAGNAWNGILEDLNVSDGEGLYQAALALPPETTIAGPVTITNNRSGVGAPGEVTHATGDLTVQNRLQGEGMLVIDGSLTVPTSGKMFWSGIVIVRAEQQYLPVLLKGEVSITGGLVIVQQAYPPGGHMDVTTFRDLGNGLTNANPRGEAPVAPWTSGFPWHQHKHRFDEDLGTRRVRYLEGGNAVAGQESWTQFEDTIRSLGSEKVYIEFENEARHGYGVYTINVDGMPNPVRGMVRDGFGAYSRGDSHQSREFRADRLEDFEVDIRSLRTLEDRFDGNGCDSWPFCIGERWDRGGALRVRLRRHTDNDILYESVLYWHMQPSEWAIYQAQEAAWRTQIQNGGLFGTRLEMTGDVSVTFDISPVLDLVDRLGFDGNEVIHLGSEVEHLTRDENFAAAQLSSGSVRMCHDPTGTATNRDVPSEEVEENLGRGDTLGNCDGSPVSNNSAPSPAPANPANPTDPNNPGNVAVCVSGVEQIVPWSAVGGYLLSGGTVGGCPDTMPGPWSTRDIVMCYNGSSVAVRLIEYGWYTNQGATFGACP